MVALVSAHSWRTGRRNRLLLLFLGLALVLAGPTTSTAAPLRGSVSAETTDGYARLVFVLSEDVDASARIAGNVLILTFAKPVAVSVDSLPAQAPSYISEARRDPDGRAVRFALSRKVTVNSMAAADKLFVDLLPDTWRGPPPGLPQDVVEELARLARDAERLEHLAHQKEKQKKLIPVPVHVASLPTFTRYVFDVPDQISVSADRAKERLTLTFDAPIPFDLSDAEAALPATIASIKAEVETDSALVRFSFVNAVDVRTFRDGKGYVVDILKGDAAAAMHEKAAAAGSPPPVLEASPSVKPPAMETGKPNWAPPAIAAQMPPAAAETYGSSSASPANSAGACCSSSARSANSAGGGGSGSASPANSAGSGDSGSASPANSAGSGDSGSASHANTAGSGGSSGAKSSQQRRRPPPWRASRKQRRKNLRLQRRQLRQQRRRVRPRRHRSSHHRRRCRKRPRQGACNRLRPLLPRALPPSWPPCTRWARSLRPNPRNPGRRKVRRRVEASPAIP